MSDMITSLFDILWENTKMFADTVEMATAEAIERADEHADPEWKEQARRAIERAAALGEFTTDDVWLQLEGVEAPHEPRALGALIREARKNGLIVATGRYRKSSRVECHGNPKMIWRAA